MVADAAVAIIVAVTVYLLRYQATTTESPIGDVETALPPVLLYAGLWVVLLFLVGEYRLRARWTLRSEALGIARAMVWLALLSMSLLFLSDLTEVSRVYLLLLFPVQAFATLGLRALLRTVFMQLRRRGRNNRQVLVLGTEAAAYEFAHRVESHTAFGLRVAGFLGEPPTTNTGPWPYLGGVSELVGVLHTEIIDEVAVCLPRADWAEVESIIQLCQEQGKIVRIPLAVPQVESRMQFVEDVDGTAVLSIVQGPDRIISLALKRTLDVASSVAALVLLSPLLLGVAMSIASRGGRPILFRQTRIGMHGRPFTILKFRTMRGDAEDQYNAIAPSSHTRGPAFKLADDPRIAPWGRWLRRTGMDELPQLWNVLRGQMSLVGPRPAPPREVDLYDHWHRRRLSMKPGLTGLWQVSSRLDNDFNDRARLDLDYIDRWSLWLDLRIVAKTVPAVIHADGR